MKTYHRVYIYDQNPQLMWNEYRKVPQPIEARSVTGEDGEFELTDLPPSTVHWFHVTNLSGPEEEMAAHSAPTEGKRVPFPRIEVYQGRDGIWRYHMRDSAGAVSITNPEKFARKWTAKRGAARFNRKLDHKVPVVILTTDEIVEVSQREAARRQAAGKAAAKSD